MWCKACQTLVQYKEKTYAAAHVKGAKHQKNVLRIFGACVWMFFCLILTLLIGSSLTASVLVFECFFCLILTLMIGISLVELTPRHALRGEKRAWAGPWGQIPCALNHVKFLSPKTGRFLARKKITKIHEKSRKITKNHEKKARKFQTSSTN